MSVSAAQLREGQQILVRGKTSFSRLASLVEGEALVKSIAQATQRGSLYPTKVPHTTINLVDVQVLAVDPSNPTPEELYVNEKIYDVKSGDNAGKRGYGIDNKSSYLPVILEQNPDVPGTYRQLEIDRDLASGLDVTIVLQVFKSGDNANRGIGLQQVVLNEPVKYFVSGVDTSALAARGIVVSGPIRAVASGDATATAEANFAAAADAAGFPANSATDTSGYAVPTLGAQGVIPAPSLAAQTFPVSAPAVAVAAPVAAPVPAPVAAPVQALETPEQTIARLQQKIAEDAAAAAGSGGASAFVQVPVAAGAGAPGPWDAANAAPAAYQG